MIERLKDLAATGFESVVFDLVSSAGLINAVWRTPGTDQGRDIEGTVQFVDFSDEYSSQKWYVECKRYEGSIDWPTVWRKLAYADSHHADYLLIVTTGTLSPQAKSEVARWNSEHRTPQVRFWDATVLERVLLQHPIVVAKHRLTDAIAAAAPAFLDLSRQGAKCAQAAYGRAVLKGNSSPELEAAAANAELLTARLLSFQNQEAGAFSGFVSEIDTYEWLTIHGSSSFLHGFDRYGLRAILTFVRHAQRADRLAISVTENSLVIDIDTPLCPSAASTLIDLAVWTNVEVSLSNATITLQRRSP